MRRSLRRRAALPAPAVERRRGMRHLPGAMNKLISALLWAVIGVFVILWLPVQALIFVATAPFDPGRYTAGRWFRNAGVMAAALVPYWKFRTSGHRIPDPRRPYIAVANHESYADIFLISHLPWEMKWLSKEGNFKIPVMGWMMRMAGDIEVYRGKAASRAQAVAQINDRLDKRVSVMIMPEGTRSRTDELLPFRDGAFRIAIDRQLPILPMAVAGTRECMEPDSLIFRRATAEVRVLEPIETTGMGPEDVGALKERVRALIVETRAQLRRELAAR